ncbi:acyl carrier protein [Saccharothrix australiensis]|uniref:Act minimal PKS acyl carrier protein n=1 Tax=Saccharothrix australiensis TaxID=2072 RepID=A0A495W3J2_9PSEU|nr:acyl carrier protein [Saccharothrix australiensis]RKT55660.1 act minimal PKS acyl carrier protein [Saccharothrix australiensis]
MITLTITDFGRIVESCVGTGNVAALDTAALDTEFADLGIDSLAVYEIVTRLQDELGVRISDDEIERLTTPRALIAFVNEGLAADV